jgi:hypothetical protein
MEYFAIAMGLACFYFAATGKELPFKRPSLIDLSPAANRVILAWGGLVMTSFGVYLIIQGHKR